MSHTSPACAELSLPCCCSNKYNAVLRGLQTQVFFLQRELIRLCCSRSNPLVKEYLELDGNDGRRRPTRHEFECVRELANRYTTTIFAINSLIVKTSKLTKAQPVYRGVARLVLPEQFWQNNDFGVKGGVESAVSRSGGSNLRTEDGRLLMSAGPAMDSLCQPHATRMWPSSMHLISKKRAALASSSRCSRAWSTAAPTSLGCRNILMRRRSSLRRSLGSRCSRRASRTR